MKLSDPRLLNIPTFDSGVVIDDRLFLALHHQGDNALPGHLAQQSMAMTIDDHALQAVCGYSFFRSPLS